VANVIRNEKAVEKQTRNKSSYFAKYKQQIKQWLDKKYSKLRIYEILSQEHDIDRTYDSMCKYIQKHFPKKREAFGVQITYPGEEAEVDFGYLGLFPDNNGKTSRAYVFVITLSYSRKAYYVITDDQKIQSVLNALIGAFTFFDGVPTKVKVDNMRTAILRNQHYDLQFNKDLLDFANYYNFVIKPCAPYKPNQKGKVEAGVKYVQNNFLVGRTFTSRMDMRQQLKSWTVNYANKRTHGTTKKVPEVVFMQKEKNKLLQLPENPYLILNRSTRSVKPNCHISFQNNYYSVPSKYAGDSVVIRWNQEILRILSETTIIATHKINHSQGEYITVRSHLPEYKVYSETEYQERYETKMREIGEHAHKYFQRILSKKHGYWFRSMRGILGLVKEFGNERVNLSLQRALNFNVLDLTTIRNICERQLYLYDEQPKLLETTEGKVEYSKLIGTTNRLVVQRDLSYYKQICKT